MGETGMVEQVRAPLGFRDAVLCGRGATSRVYRATSGKTGQPVALKRLHRHLVRSQDALARLKRELEALRALNHPGIVNVWEVIAWEGDPTLVMEFVDGEDLKEHITRHGPLSTERALQVARELLDILATTHAAGIVHRDLKPQNIRLGKDGRIRLLDFGSARLDAASMLTATGTTVGTPEYMAPELFAGSVYDPRADIYGVGATLFECLTGGPPHHADSQAQLAFLKSTRDAPALASQRADAGPVLCALVDRCLQRLPEDRYATATLASWSLDHPEAEAAFRARRSNNPLCLHCHNAIAPESTLCPVCKSDHPFSYAPGPCHVELRTVQDASRFLEYVVLHFPSRGQPVALMALAADVAALGQGPVRYVSFIEEQEAAAVVKELLDIGVGAQVVQPGRLSPAGVMAVLGAGLAWVTGAADMGILGAAASVGGIFALERLFHVSDARQGVLGHGRGDRKHWYRLTHALWGTVAAVGAATVTGLHGTLDAWTFYGATWLAGAAAASTLAASRLLEGRRQAQLPSPEAPLQKQMALALTSSERALARPSEVKAASSLTAVVLAMGLVPLEMTLMRDVAGLLARGGAVVVQPAPTPGTPVPGGGGGGAAPARVWRVKPSEVAGVLVGGTPAAASLLALVWMQRRRRRGLQDGAQVFKELDLERFQQLAQRSSPRLAAGGRDVTRPLALLPTRDEFAQQALRRAVDLAPYLSRDTLQQLAESVGALSDVPDAAAHNASVLARCIMETDADQEVRFRFLRLEGELEAKAAEVWLERVRKGGR